MKLSCIFANHSRLSCFVLSILFLLIDKLLDLFAVRGRVRHAKPTLCNRCPSVVRNVPQWFIHWKLGAKCLVSNYLFQHSKQAPSPILFSFSVMNFLHTEHWVKRSLENALSIFSLCLFSLLSCCGEIMYFIFTASPVTCSGSWRGCEWTG